MEIPDDLLAILAKLFGLALTIGAVMLGAPFWFDLLSKIMRVRSTGAPPPASDAVRKGEGEQARAGPGAARLRRELRKDDASDDDTGQTCEALALAGRPSLVRLRLRHARRTR